MTAAGEPASEGERADLGRAVADLFTAASSEPDVRRVMASADGVDLDLWSAMAGMGLTSLLVPSALGGGGATLGEVAVVAEQAGRFLACVPLLSTTLASATLARLDGDAAREVLARTVAGARPTLVASSPDGAGVAGQRVATRGPAGWTVDGYASLVLDGATATDLVVAADVAGVPGLFHVDPASAGVRRTGSGTLDQTRRLAGIEFRGAAAVPLGDAPATPVLSAAYDVAGAVLAAEQVGGAAAVLDLAVRHARTRMQFGRAVGSFQAVKHHCANMVVLVELARTAAAAATATPLDDADLARAAAVAQSYCAEAFYRCASTAVQVLGGIGFTWEHPAHLYLKRARSGLVLFGDPRSHRRRLGGLVGLG